jgi:hypothetical protein
MMASPPLHTLAPNVLPVAMNGLMPSLATPPTDHAPPPVAGVAQAMTLVGWVNGTPTSQP